jgi:glutamyl-tRNA synthetase/glutamyl-Q tRNA(Asp) synthetase
VAAVAALLPRGFTTRFAPAPTGHLHLGHLVNAVWVWGLAAARGGRVLLRIEDHDGGRSRPEYERSILDDLDWLELAPHGVGTDAFRAGPTSQRQRDRRASYDPRLRALENAALAYPCRCSRAEILRATDAGDDLDTAEPRYPGTCRAAAVGPRAHSARRVIMHPGAELVVDLRLGSDAQDPASQCGDLLVRDRNDNYTYQFAVVVDDLDHGVDVVIRGEDLLPSCGRQQRLGSLLGRAAPPLWVHHPLVMHPDGRKLSKSAGDTGVRELRAAGRSAEDVLGVAAQAAGLQADAAPWRARDLGDLFR